MTRGWAIAFLVTLASGCASEEGPKREPEGGGGGESRGGDVAPPPPDAGTATGHGADRTRVRVPDEDSSPPSATITLADLADRTLGKASRPGSRAGAEVKLVEPRLRGTAVGEDENGGIVRVRVSISERITCERSDGGRVERLQSRYFPPPQIEQLRAAPGARLPTRAARSRLIELAGDRCGSQADPVAVVGRLWAEVINGHGLETISPAVPLSWRG